MKTKMIAGPVILAAFLIAGSILLSAFRSSPDTGKAKLVSDIRTYLDKNVKPIMQPQRARLDQMLTADEKKEISSLNNQLRQLIRTRNATGIGFISAPEFDFSQVQSSTPGQKAGRKASRDEMRRIMAHAWTIADRHDTEIAQLLGEKSSFYGTWQRGLSALVKDYLDDKFLFIGSNRIVQRVGDLDIIRYYSPVAFLLWDPQTRFIGDELIKK